MISQNGEPRVDPSCLGIETTYSLRGYEYAPSVTVVPASTDRNGKLCYLLNSDSDDPNATSMSTLSWPQGSIDESRSCTEALTTVENGLRVLEQEAGIAPDDLSALYGLDGHALIGGRLGKGFQATQYFPLLALVRSMPRPRENSQAGAMTRWFPAGVVSRVLRERADAQPPKSEMTREVHRRAVAQLGLIGTRTTTKLTVPRLYLRSST